MHIGRIRGIPPLDGGGTAGPTIAMPHAWSFMLQGIMKKQLVAIVVVPAYPIPTKPTQPLGSNLPNPTQSLPNPYPIPTGQGKVGGAEKELTRGRSGWVGDVSVREKKRYVDGWMRLEEEGVR